MILAKKGKLQVCMKCSLIQKIQNYNFIRTILVKKQKAKGLPEGTSDEFTYEFRDAIAELQSNHGLVSDGIIGLRTLTLINAIAKDEEKNKINQPKTTLEPTAPTSTTLEPPKTTTPSQTTTTQNVPSTKIALDSSIYNKKEIPVAGFDDEL
jgi:murein L,D-transpeptidase YcbB/YkuD